MLQKVALGQVRCGAGAERVGGFRKVSAGRLTVGVVVFMKVSGGRLFCWSGGF